MDANYQMSANEKPKCKLLAECKCKRQNQNANEKMTGVQPSKCK
jgi:hypothetical protein